MTSRPKGVPERYEVGRVLGVGSFGCVYQARDAETGGTVALKVIHKDHLSDGRAMARVKREVEAYRALDHPGIVRVLDARVDATVAYMAMEYLPAPDLKTQLKGHVFAARETAVIVRDAALALHHLHAAGMVHRDVKPANVVVTPELRTVVMDLGLALTPDATPLTASGRVVGTPSYLAPEVYKGLRASPRSDLYALGLVLYELLTGRLPHAGVARLEAMRLQATERPPAPSTVNRAVPRELDAVALRCLEPEPARRYADGAALAEDLDRWLALAGDAVMPPPPAASPVVLSSSRDAPGRSGSAAGGVHVRAAPAPPGGPAGLPPLVLALAGLAVLVVLVAAVLVGLGWRPGR